MTYTIEKGSEQRYINEEIHFQDALIVEGKAIFENCRIFCNEVINGNNITVKNNGILQFNNCQITSCGINKPEHEYACACAISRFQQKKCQEINSFSSQMVDIYNQCFFIMGMGGSLIVDECIIKNFYHFAGGIFHTVETNDCEYKNCLGGLFDIGLSSNPMALNQFMYNHKSLLFKITNCRFLCKQAPSYFSKQEEEGLGILLQGNFTISNTSFELGMLPLKLFNLDGNSELKNCKFINVNDVPADLCYGMTTCIDCQFEIKPKGETK